MERLKELQRSSGGPPPPAASRPSYHPDEMDPGIAPAVLPTVEQGNPTSVNKNSRLLNEAG